MNAAIRLLSASWLACVLLASGAMASEHGDHDRARAALQAGEILPLSTVMQRLTAQHPGQVMEVELERDDGRWVYEIKLLSPDGGLLKLEVDAASARVLKARPRRQERR